jgi:hypothetical protein
MINQYLPAPGASGMEPKDWIDLAGQLLVFAGLIFGAVKYANGKRGEFQKRFFEEQLALFTEAVDNAAIILVYDKHQDEYKTAVKDFKRLYWGKMCMAEDAKVESEMVAFYDLLNKYDAESSLVKAEEIKEALQQLVLNLAHSCRNSTLHTWGIKDRLWGYNDYTLQYEKEPKKTSIHS